MDRRELIPDKKKHCISSQSVVKYIQNKNEQAATSMCSSDNSVKEPATDYETTRENIHTLKKQLLNEGFTTTMTQTNSQHSNTEKSSELRDNKLDLELQVSELREEIHRLKLECDVYEKAAKILKKDQGINISSLNNREKAMVINALRGTYRLNELLKTIKMAKSSYCYQAISLVKDKYADLRIKVKNAFVESSNRYGYRRLHSILRSTGTPVSEKIIRWIMRTENLIVANIKRKKYSSYQGEISPEVDNILKRDFHADTPKYEMAY
jgi:hypothetical protein